MVCCENREKMDRKETKLEVSETFPKKRKVSNKLCTLLGNVFPFYNPSEGIGFYRSFEYWFDNIPFIERNFLNLVSLWLGLIVFFLMSPLFYVIYLQLCYIF